MTAATMSGAGPDLADPATYAVGVPHAEFARRRREDPVGWVEEPMLRRHSGAGQMATRGTGYWAVTTYDAVLAASRQPDVFSSGQRGAFLADPRTPADLARARELLVNMDAPRHLRVRRLVTSVFTPRAVRALAGSVREHAHALVTGIAGTGHFDVVTDLAAELPLLVLADLLGMPRADRHLLYRWSNSLVGFDDPEFGGGNIETYRAAFGESFHYALRLAVDRREHPRDDLVSLLANAEVDGRRLTDREFCNFWLLLVVAGNETTRHLISGSLTALTEHPGELARLVSGQVELAASAEELIRWVTPIMQFRRTATRDTSLAGRVIAEGDKVVLYYTSANRDEAAIPGAGRLDLGRLPNPHVAFGVGPHFCLGAHLARLELSSLLGELTPYLPRLEVAGPAVRLESNFVNGMKSVPARFR